MLLTDVAKRSSYAGVFSSENSQKIDVVNVRHSNILSIGSYCTDGSQYPCSCVSTSVLNSYEAGEGCCYLAVSST